MDADKDGYINLANADAKGAGAEAIALLVEEASAYAKASGDYSKSHWTSKLLEWLARFILAGNMRQHLASIICCDGSGCC